MPVPSAGVKDVMGNMKPVMVVSAVVARNTCVTQSGAAPRSMATRAISPVTMAMMLISVCSSTNVSNDSPSIIIPRWRQLRLRAFPGANLRL